jgi:ubiquinone/menaquinone biosynthesis C-methylase UbiE
MSEEGHGRNPAARGAMEREMTEAAKCAASNDEVSRLRDVYAKRDAAMPHASWEANIYHPRHPLGHLFHEHNHDALVAALNALAIDLDGLDVLDVGCGYGYWLRYLVDLGADPGRLTGIDLSRQRIEAARTSNPAIRWVHSEDEALPFPSDSFDIVLQSVVFSSILEEEKRSTLASEMSRVVRSGGHVLWVDHKRSFAETLAGFSQTKVREYFPSGEIAYAESVHPRYFRRMYGRRAWLAQAIYRLTKVHCDSWFLALEVRK